MFLIGVTGTAKSTIWKNLCRALTNMDWLTVWDIVDPKAVTSDELYGLMNPKSREWKDGVLCVMMRDMVKNQGKFKSSQKYKWCVLDGDVDPEWIESLNTVMDDNKVLTLVSQERIPLTPEMRLVLEVSNLRNATPATVSRGGVLFVNESDIGWRPFFESWLGKFKARGDEHATNVFTLNLTHFMTEAFFDQLRNWETIAPVCDMAYLVSMTTIIDYLYNQLHSTKEDIEFLKRLKEEGGSAYEDAIKLIYEGFFVFAIVWACGGPILDAKVSFSNSIKAASTRVKYPEGGQVFDYYFKPTALDWDHWSNRVKSYDTGYEGLFNNLVVPTAETTRQKFLIDVHRVTKKGMLFVGNAGTGKTVILKDYFSECNLDTTVCATLNFNNYTDSKALQQVIESNVDKRTGRIFGPPTGKILIFFMDDMNMPALDGYGTQSPICLIRQIIDYTVVFDRDHLEEKKEIHDIMFIGCMNPKSGSFNIDIRLTRHFTMISLGVPEREILTTIYEQLLSNHLSTWDHSFKGWDARIVNATMDVFNIMCKDARFMPTARKFHYQFNLRDFSKIIQNIMNSQNHVFKGQPLMFARLWAHECHRVWLDRLLFPEDIEAYMGFMNAALKNFPGDLKAE
jgi:dynein heavy chain